MDETEIEILKQMKSAKTNPLTNLALDKAIKALKNQPKYEAVLQLMAERLAGSCRECQFEGSCLGSAPINESCTKTIGEYFKKKVGLGVAK